MHRTSLVATAVALQLAGCSMLAVSGPPRGARRTGSEPVDCTMHSAAPAIDFVLAGAGLALSLLAGAVASIPGEAIGDQEDPGGGGAGTTLVGIALLSLPFATSGLIGSSRIGECQEVNALDAPP